MSVRSDVVQLLSAGLPSGSYDVLPFTKNLEGRMTRLTVMVETSSFEPGPVSGVWTVNVNVFLVSPHESYDSAETQLEDAVTDVLLNLDSTANLFNRAERVTIADKFHAYRIEANFPFEKDN